MTLSKDHPLTADERAFVERHRPLAVKLAMAPRYADCVLDGDQRISAAFLGLCYAARYYDPAGKWKPSTYITMCVRRQIYIDSQQSPIVRVPSYLWDGRKTPGKDACRAVAAAVTVVYSLDAPRSYLESGIGWGTNVADPLGEDEPDRFRRCEELQAAFDHLPIRQADVMRLTVDGYTIPEIAADLGLHVETIRFHYRNGLKSLRRLMVCVPSIRERGKTLEESA